MSANKYFFLVLAVIVGGCATSRPAALERTPPGSRQAIIVEANPHHKTRAHLSFWEKHGNAWQKIYASPAMIGRQGMAAGGAKKEGDGKTPSGVYNLTSAFGYYPAVKTGLPYQQTHADDFWVDDVDSDQYNQWVKGVPNGTPNGTPRAKSYETLLRQDHLYKLAVVIDYNMDPVVPGAGSAIFMHIWRRWDHATAGCVALSERNLRRILKRLDQKSKPVILLEEKSYGP